MRNVFAIANMSECRTLCALWRTAYRAELVPGISSLQRVGALCWGRFIGPFAALRTAHFSDPSCLASVRIPRTGTERFFTKFLKVSDAPRHLLNDARVAQNIRFQ